MKTEEECQIGVVLSEGGGWTVQEPCPTSPSMTFSMILIPDSFTYHIGAMGSLLIDLSGFVFWMREKYSNTSNKFKDTLLSYNISSNMKNMPGPILFSFKRPKWDTDINLWNNLYTHKTKNMVTITQTLIIVWIYFLNLGLSDSLMQEYQKLWLAVLTLSGGDNLGRPMPLRTTSRPFLTQEDPRHQEVLTTFSSWSHSGQKKISCIILVQKIDLAL